MEEDQAQGIRFFDTRSRIGRVRYLAYGWAIGAILLPFTFTGVYLILSGSVLWGGVILLVMWIIGTPIHFTFMIRRLHDLGRTGWWCLIYAMTIPFSIVRFL